MGKILGGSSNNSENRYSTVAHYPNATYCSALETFESRAACQIFTIPSILPKCNLQAPSAAIDNIISYCLHMKYRNVLIRATARGDLCDRTPPKDSSLTQLNPNVTAVITEPVLRNPSCRTRLWNPLEGQVHSGYPVCTPGNSWLICGLLHSNDPSHAIAPARHEPRREENRSFSLHSHVMHLNINL